MYKAFIDKSLATPILELDFPFESETLNWLLEWLDDFLMGVSPKSDAGPHLSSNITYWGVKSNQWPDYSRKIERLMVLALDNRRRVHAKGDPDVRDLLKALKKKTPMAYEIKLFQDSLPWPDKKRDPMFLELPFLCPASLIAVSKEMWKFPQSMQMVRSMLF